MDNQHPTVAPADLIAELHGLLGDAVITDDAECELLSGDFYSQGTRCAAAIRPPDTASLAAAVRTITGAGYALIPRGGGMSYTGGYTPDRAAAIIVDLSALQGIVDFEPHNMTVTVRAGTTWETLYDELAPHGLRLPFFGTFSGRRATVGGGLSNGALFLGSGRYGSAADNVLGIEVVTANGQVLRTGQAAVRNGKAFYRTHGPDLTGLFLHDSGALGIKTEATFRLIKMPQHTTYLSWAFADAPSAAAALSAIGRSGAAEEAYVFDPPTTARNLAGSSLKNDIGRLGRIVTGQGSWLDGLRAGARVVTTGKAVVPEQAWSLHLVCAGRSKDAAVADLESCRRLLLNMGGKEIPNSIPMAVRAAPFDSLNSVLGPDGERWAALNAKVTHGDAAELITRFDQLISPQQRALADLHIDVSLLFIALQTHAFSFEPVFHWRDSWLPMHRAIPDAAHLSKLTEPEPHTAARTFVAELRQQTLALFDAMGVASNQMGRTYQYYQKLAPETAALIRVLKQELDPAGLMNPGVLGLPGHGDRQ